MSEAAALTVQNLTLTAHTGKARKTLVSGLSFSIEQNQVLGLVGESGCGKSLTCLAVMGLLPSGIRRTAGDICLNGRSIQDLTPVHMRSLRGKTAAMILQNPMSCFDAVFTVRRHFKETLASHGFNSSGTASSRIAEALVEVGFEHPDEILDLYPFQMSGGMLQRVMVALALLLEAPLLIADEPTTDLDVVSQARVLDLLARIRTDHDMSILLVTHDLSVVARLADRVAVMRQGEVVESGTVADVFTRPRHPYTGALVEAHLSHYGQHLTMLLEANDRRGVSDGHDGPPSERNDVPCISWK